MRATLHSAPSSPDVGRIEFTDEDHDRSRYYTCTGTFEINGEESSVQLEMIDAYCADMLGFFEELARDAAAGSSGTNAWRSEFAEMELIARNGGEGIIAFDVLMRWPPDYAVERSGILHVRADELPRFIETLRSILRMERGERFTYGQTHRD